MNRKAVARAGNSQTEVWLSGATLFVTILLVYQPAWRAGFIWDDDVYVTGNPLLTAPDGLRRIWFSLDSPSQYFPLVYTSFYFERMLWGLHAAGYHAVNIVIHVVNALVLWRLLERLRFPGALIGAAIFALHPVQVESVAWITERKNVLMGLCFLLSLRAWTEFVDEKTVRRWRFYAGALVLYALALAAKTTACTLPAALLVILWLKRMRLDRRRVAQVAPFVVLGAGMGLVTIWWERYHIGTRGTAFTLGPIERGLIACRAIWFYLGKLVWPSNLAFSYPRWNISTSDAKEWFWVVLTVAAGWAIWVTRKGVGKTIGLAAFFYVTTLAPILGFIMLYTFRYTFVADHYQYLACIGPAVLAGAAVVKATDLWAGKARGIIVAGGVLIAALGILSWRQAGVYATDELLWRDTLAKNPRSWLACNNLGNDLLDRGDTDGAIAQFHAALQLEPKLAENYANLGNAFSQKGQVDDAIEQYNNALGLDPSVAEVHFNLANALRQKGQNADAIAQYRRAVELKPTYAEARSNLGYVLFQLRDLPDAIEQWEKAVELEPNNVGALNNLAWILATCPIDRLRDGAKALALAQRASQLDSGNPVVLRALAAAYAETGKSADAVKAAQSALALATAQGNAHLASSLMEQIKLHQAGLPFRDASQIPQ